MHQSDMLEASTDRYPLTSRQRDPRHSERASQHVIRIALRVRGELDAAALQTALDEVVRRHESLRTRVHYDATDGSRGFQQVLPPLPVPLTVQDIPEHPGSSRDEVAVELYRELHEEPLVHFAMPSLRAALHRFDDRDAVLTLMTHHLFGDNWSAGVLMREVAACYRAAAGGGPHGLAEPVQYREFAAWEQRFQDGEEAAAARRYWAGELAGAEMLTLPGDRVHGPDTLAPSSAVRDFSVDAGAFAKVLETARECRCTTWHVLLAAGMVLFERLRGTTDITLLTVDNGRSAGDFHSTIGFFANLVPLRLNFGGCTTYRDLMRVARRAAVQGGWQQLPFETVLGLAPDLLRSFADPEAVQFAFNFARPAAALDDLQFAGGVTPVRLPQDVPTRYHRGGCQWSLTVLPTGVFRCVIEYEPDAVDAETVDRWATDFIDLILAIADGPDRPWKDR